MARLPTVRAMKLLAIDTAAHLCAAAVLDAGSPGAARPVVRDIGKGHVEHLMAVIGEALALAGCGYRDLTRIAVATGPGSFTGLRVGISAARGLALALGVPAVGVTTLDAIAAEAAARFPGVPVLAAIDARRGQAYWSAYDAAGLPSAGPALAPVADIALRLEDDRIVLAGSGARLVAAAAGLGNARFGPEGATADIGTYARLGAEAEPGEKPRPLYLRPPDAKPQTLPAIAGPHR
jgi:tRNA threonylcarbamoyl adenosine modification protein YeaZ